MKIESSRDVCHNYRILSEGKTPDRGSYIVRMVTENHMPGFLDCRIQEIDAGTRYLYDVTSRQSLEDILETEKITGQFLELLYSSLLAAIRNLEEFLLDENGIQLRPSLVFLNAERTRIYFIYYPDEEEPFSDQLKNLGETMLPHLDHGDRKSVIMGYAFYQKASEGSLCAGDFQELLEECRPKPEPESRDLMNPGEKERREQREKILDEFFEEDDGTVGEGVFSRIRNWFSRMKRKDESSGKDESSEKEESSGKGEQGESRDFLSDRKRKARRTRPEPISTGFPDERDGKGPPESTGNMAMDMIERREDHSEGDEDGGKETVLLTAGTREADPKALAVLLPDIREQGSEDRTWKSRDQGSADRSADSRTGALELWKTNHILGKSRKSADLILSVPTVSRIHARFVYREEGYCIIDLNSKNGTFRNGELLVSGEAYPLRDGDRLRFSDQSFTYHTSGIVQQPPESV
ncbi:MAG: DUF6382 domain-containing protein [Bilifractor sp.]|jgi:hypothetical protein